MKDIQVVSRDKQTFNQKKPSDAEYLLYARQKSNRGYVSIALEFKRLHAGRGKLTYPEYVQFGVYNPELSKDEQTKFITSALHWPITHICCDMNWQATTEDKWLCSHILERSNVPVPRTLAVIDKAGREYLSTRKISTAAELRDFAVSQNGSPFFGKENREIASFGAFLVLEAEKDRLHLKGEGWLDYETCMDQFIGSTSYLLQSLVSNHSFFDRYTDNLASVRVCILLTKEGVKIPFAILKLPTCDNLADSFWRPGNLACDLDPKTGIILKARTKDHFGTTDYTDHPESNKPLVGETVPLWDQVINLVHTCSPIFAPVRYQSMDIAVTSDGPVLIEINTGGGWDLPQLASGRGFLTDDVCEFFRACGYDKV
ncbi:MAG: sugar-transfer associated ATP-grasp domain-containing protein [Thiotrichaceae bacterium]